MAVRLTNTPYSSLAYCITLRSHWSTTRGRPTIHVSYVSHRSTLVSYLALSRIANDCLGLGNLDPPNFQEVVAPLPRRGANPPLSRESPSSDRGRAVKG